LHRFFSAGGVSGEKGEYTIETSAAPNLEGEAFRLEIGPKICRIIAGNIEGIRRGIFHIEDEMLSNRGPFLTIVTIEKSPFIKRRISRCFFWTHKEAAKDA